MFKNLYSLRELSREDIISIFELTKKIKKEPAKYITALKDKTLVMIFEFQSLRTRISFETGMTQMGGHAIYLKSFPSPEKTAASSRESTIYSIRLESMKDRAKVLSRYGEVIAYRALRDERVKQMIQFSDIPVINIYTHNHHPCQGLTDLYTILEKKGKIEGLKLAFFGDAGEHARHIINELLMGGAKLGLNVTVSVPEMNRYMPQESVWKYALDEAKESGAKIVLEHNPMIAARDADVVYSSYHIMEMDDVWEIASRCVNWPPYQVNTKLLSYAKPDAIVMHEMPAYRGFEITDAVIDGPQSVVYDEAENRLHVQKAILLQIVEAHEEDN